MKQFLFKYAPRLIQREKKLLIKQLKIKTVNMWE